MIPTTLRTAPALAAGLVLLFTVGCSSTPATPPVVAEPLPEPVAPTAEPVVEPAPAPLQLRPDYPERYVVVRGDTLWDISTRFLESPWRWPELWQENPQIANPHLIYPGDILTLIFIDGRPVMQVQRDDRVERVAEPAWEPRPAQEPRDAVVRLSPSVRVEPFERAIPTIPMDAIRQFLSRPRVVERGELDRAPYILATPEERLIVGAGNQIYVRGIEDNGIAEYVVVRAGQPLRNPQNRRDILGYEAIQVATARVQRMGDPTLMMITASSREVMLGDRLLPPEMSLVETNMVPRAPSMEVDGQIISVIDGVTQVGQYQVVALNLGLQDDIERGHVLAVHQAGRTVRDPQRGGQRVNLPSQRAGSVLVFRVFDRFSYALVMEATRPIHVGDMLKTP